MLNRNLSKRVGRSAFRLRVLCLALLSFILIANRINAAINHPPIISWLPDQRVTTGSGWVTKYFRIIDPDGTTSFTFPKQSTNSMWYSAQNVAVSACDQADFDAGCADDLTGYKVTFSNTPATPGYAAIRLGAQDTGSPALTSYTSFTLRVDAMGTINPPSIGALPNRVLQLQTSGVATYTTHFVIGDLDTNGMEDVSSINAGDFILRSSNQMLLDNLSIAVTLNPADDYYAPLEPPRSYTLTATTKVGAAPGVTTVTVELSDPDLIPNYTSTSFVLQTVANSDAPPSFGSSSDGTYLVCPVPTPNPTPPQYHFTVISNDSTPVEDLRVTARSSNTNLVSNDATHLFCSTPAPTTGIGTVTIIPNLPLPTPSPGVPQSSTITLTVSDGSYQRQSTFLYVASDNTSPAIAFGRPAGVYLLDASQFDHRDSAFLTGETLAVSWAQVESVEGTYVWDTLNGAILNVPQDQDISLNIQEEACYIANSMHDPPVREFGTWCDGGGGQPLNLVNCKEVNPCGTGGTARPVPWDSYLQDRRNAFYEQLKTNLTETGAISRISTINPNLPGANAGIRKVSMDFDDMPGYTRQRLLATIQDELRALQDKFPGKLIQIGFFTANDDDSDPPLWKWLYKDATTDPNALDENSVHLVALFDEFNGVKRPRVSFFQENLAATRTVTPNGAESSSSPNYITPALTTAYTSTPISSVLPAFAYYSAPTNDQYRNGTNFQSNTPWSQPFTETQGLKLTRTINGSPNDALEAAFNAYLSQYLEVYPKDVDEAEPPFGGSPTLNAELWQGQLQSWHDYADHLRSDLTPLEAPAGLTVERESVTNNLVKWHAVYRAASYALQRRDIGTESADWVDVFGCTTVTETQCQDSTSTDAIYGYRVRAKNDDGSIETPWAYVAVFVSEGTLIANYDGFVQMNGTVMNAASEPGIKAGRGTGMNNFKGFLSFNTSALAGATVLTAKLRMYEVTGTAFDEDHPCHIDVKKGAFNGNLTLEGSDFSALSTHDDAAQMQPPSTELNWFEAEILPIYLADINNSTGDFGRTQFRLSFTGLGTNKQATWYAGDTYAGTLDKPPQLIVQYQPQP